MIKDIEWIGLEVNDEELMIDFDSICALIKKKIEK
jgi:hypothetical protein